MVVNHNSGLTGMAVMSQPRFLEPTVLFAKCALLARASNTLIKEHSQV